MGNSKKHVDAFFRWVWRITGLLLLLLVLYGAVSVVRSLSSRDLEQAPDGAAIIGRLDRPDQHQAALKLGSFEALPGTSVLYARLGSEEATVGSLSSSFVTTDMHNLLFFDTASRQAHWLLDDNRRTIAALSVISGRTPASAQGAERESLALGLLLLTRTAQTHDRSEIPWDIRLASVDGRQLKTLASGIDTLLDHQLVDEHTLLVFYARHGEVHVLDVDPATHEVRSDRALPARN